MKVAIVHDDLIQWGGAERMLLSISEIFPDAPIYTSLYDSQNKNLNQYFQDKKIITSFMQQIPGWRSLHKALFWLYPMAFEQFDFSEFDLVITQTTRFAKSIITKPQTKHICYCHTPPRFLWHFSGENIPGLAKPFLSWLRIYDQISSQRVDQWLAGSKNAKIRIKKVYGADSKLLYPFVNTPKREVFDGDYFLVIARLNKYKRVDLAVEACSQLRLSLKVVGTGPELEQLKRNNSQTIDFLGSVTDETLYSLLAGCRALIVTAEEDFGLTPLEAQSFGKGVIAYGVGGVLETVIDKKTGLFFNSQTVESLMEALKKFEKLRVNPKDCQQNAARFSREIFTKRLLELIH